MSQYSSCCVCQADPSNFIIESEEIECSDHSTTIIQEIVILTCLKCGNKETYFPVSKGCCPDCANDKIKREVNLEKYVDPTFAEFAPIALPRSITQMGNPFLMGPHLNANHLMSPPLNIEEYDIKHIGQEYDSKLGPVTRF